MKTLKTFIVEDSPVIRVNLIAALEEVAPVLVVGMADNESSAALWLADPRNDCDIAIVDLFLREGSGLGVLRYLQPGQRNIRRVVLTNYATPDVRRQCLALGASRVFDKSAELDQLFDYCLALGADDVEPPSLPTEH